MRPPARSRVEARVWKRLNRVIDPHTSGSVVRMGLVDGIDLEGAEGGLAVTIRFRPDNPHCPLVGEMTEAMEEQARRVRGVARVQVVVCPPPEVARHA